MNALQIIILISLIWFVAVLFYFQTIIENETEYNTRFLFFITIVPTVLLILSIAVASDAQKEWEIQQSYEKGRNTNFYYTVDTVWHPKKQ